MRWFLVFGGGFVGQNAIMAVYLGGDGFVDCGGGFSRLLMGGDAW